MQAVLEAMEPSRGRFDHFDQTAGGLYRGNYAAASFSYLQILDEDYTSTLSVGFQASLVNKRLDVSRISFAEHYAGTGFDLSRPSNQSFQNTSIGYLDVNAGLLTPRPGTEAASMPAHPHTIWADPGRAFSGTTTPSSTSAIPGMSAVPSSSESTAF